MLAVPPLSNWHIIHPLIIHFPIALLLIAPIFILAGVARKSERGFPFLVTALILMAVGTVSVFAAASSGDAALLRAKYVPEAKAILEQHEELAETTEIAFSALTLIFASILFAPQVLRREHNRTIATVLPLVFLLFYATGVISLANTAYLGDRLVHQADAKAHVPTDSSAEEFTGLE